MLANKSLLFFTYGIVVIFLFYILVGSVVYIILWSLHQCACMYYYSIYCLLCNLCVLLDPFGQVQSLHLSPLNSAHNMYHAWNA